MGWSTISSERPARAAKVPPTAGAPGTAWRTCSACYLATGASRISMSAARRTRRSPSAMCSLWLAGTNSISSGSPKERCRLRRRGGHDHQLPVEGSHVAAWRSTALAEWGGTVMLLAREHIRANRAGIDTVELPLGERRRVPLTLEFSFSAGAQRIVHLLLASAVRNAPATAASCVQRGCAGRPAGLRRSGSDCIPIRRRACSGHTSCGHIARTRRCRVAEDHRREVRRVFVRIYSARLSSALVRGATKLISDYVASSTDAL